MIFLGMWASESKLQTETLLSFCTCMVVIYDPPSWLPTLGCCMGTSALGTGISGSSEDWIWAVSTWVGDAVVAWASGVVTGVAEPEVTGVGVMLVTCLLLVLCLLPVRTQKTLVIKPWLLSTCSYLTCPLKNSKYWSST